MSWLLVPKLPQKTSRPRPLTHLVLEQSWINPGLYCCPLGKASTRRAKALKGVDTKLAACWGHRTVGVTGSHCTHLPMWLPTQTALKLLQREGDHCLPLMSRSGLVPGKVHIACAKCPKTVASRVESFGPMMYFLSPAANGTERSLEWHCIVGSQGHEAHSHYTFV